MLILTYHRISDPETFWSRGKTLLDNLPPYIRLHQEFPSVDGSTIVFVWEAESVEAVKNYVGSYLLGLSTDEYYPVAGYRTSALITPDIGLPLPSAIAFPLNVIYPGIVLLTVKRGGRGGDGVRVKYWNPRFNFGVFSRQEGWGDWNIISPAPPITTLENGGNYFPALGWLRGEFKEYYHWNAFFSFESGQKMGEAWEDFTALRKWSLWDPPSGGFDPRTGFTWKHGAKNYLNIFGYAFPPELREFWFDGAGWHWNLSHGLPPNSKDIQLGPQSAIWPAGNNNQFAYVFVTSTDKDPANPDRLWARYWHFHDGWDWSIDLGHPDDVNKLREPLAISYQDPVNNQPHIIVFVVGFSSDTKRYKLYSRYWHDGDWEDWKSWGHPDGVGNGYGSGFHLTSGVVWYEGATLRINLFGYTDTQHSGDGYGDFTPEQNQLGVRGHLINFWWDGAVWKWGETEPCPSGYPFETASSVVFSGNGRRRISVFGRDFQGVVWERCWDTVHPPVMWRWFQHYVP